jgi:hypothetical protein
MNINLTCVHARGMCPLARQALICTYICYPTDFDTFRTSCFILSIIKSWFSMYTAFKMHVNSAFQVSPWMTVTCHSGWGDILDLLSNHVCYNTQAMPIFQVLNFLYVTSESKIFQVALGFLVNLWTPVIDCTFNSSIEKNLWKQHAHFCGVLMHWCAQNIQNF